MKFALLLYSNEFLTDIGWDTALIQLFQLPSEYHEEQSGIMFKLACMEERNQILNYVELDYRDF